MEPQPQQSRFSPVVFAVSTVLAVVAVFFIAAIMTGVFNTMNRYLTQVYGNLTATVGGPPPATVTGTVNTIATGWSYLVDFVAGVIIIAFFIGAARIRRSS